MSNLQLIILIIIGWGISPLFYKVAMNHVHPIVTSAVVAAMLVILLPIAAYVSKINLTIDSVGLIHSILGGLFMCLGTLAYFYALKTGAAGETVSLTSIYPALTLILSVLFLGEPLTLRKICGISLALVGVLILGKK